jgi:hypothetical protein
MTLLDTTKTASSGRNTAGKFGQGLIVEFAVETAIFIGTILCVLVFGWFWFVLGAIVFVAFFAWKRRSPKNVVLTYKCPNCGKLECTEEMLTNEKN